MNGDSSIGKQKVTVAALEMLGLSSLQNSYAANKPLAGTDLLVCVTPTPETGVFLLALRELGATIAACSDNAYATDNDVVAYLRERGVAIYAQSDMSEGQYFDAMERAISDVQDTDNIQIIDDGCDLTRYIADRHPRLLEKTRLITEQTTCGINFLKQLYADHKLNAPAININHCFTKQWFDNNIGIQQSLIHALTVAGISLPGKSVTIFGYGPLGQGAAQAMRASGARVGVVESDIIALMQAEMAGYTALSAEEALRQSDLCLTATGCVDTISADMIERYARPDIILGNIGHGTEEYAVRHLESNATKKTLNDHLDAFELHDGRTIYSLCKGSLVNFLAGGGNMPKVMSITFTLTILAHLQAAASDAPLPSGLHGLDADLEQESARRNFPHLQDKQYKMTDEQKRYLGKGQDYNADDDN